MKKKVFKSFVASTLLVFALSIPNYGICGKTLYGNDAGTKFCCCPGTSTCGAAECDDCDAHSI